MLFNHICRDDGFIAWCDSLASAVALGSGRTDDLAVEKKCNVLTSSSIPRSSVQVHLHILFHFLILPFSPHLPLFIIVGGEKKKVKKS